MRYIIQDSYSGYIWGDSADFAREGPIDVIDACRKLDESVGDPGRVYEVVDPFDNNTEGYVVWRADVAGSEAVPVVQDGQDDETIKAVEDNCQKLAYVVWEART